jgi:hypothetical protein
MIQEVLKQAHDEAGHFGPWKTLHLLKDRCFWWNMASEVLKALWEHGIYCYDTRLGSALCGLDWTYLTCSLREQIYPMFIDYHTRWVEAFPSKKKDSYMFAEYLQKSIIPRYGVPSKLLSDRDPAFLGNVACPDEWHYRSS